MKAMFTGSSRPRRLPKGFARKPRWLTRPWASLLCTLALLAATAPAWAESLTLKECLTRALSNNPLLSESELAVEASGKTVESAEGRHFPRLALDSTYTKREDPTTYIPAQ